MNAKQNKSRYAFYIIAVVTLVILTLSLTLTLSGAWFTDAVREKNSSKTLAFGTVSVGTVNVQQNVNKLVPGQTIGYGGQGTGGTIEYTGNVSAYYRLTFTATNNFQDKLSFTSNQTLKYVSNGNTVELYGALQANGTIDGGTIQFSPNATNTLQNNTFTLTVKLDIVQAANISSISNTGNMTTVENYRALFNGVAL